MFTFLMIPFAPLSPKGDLATARKGNKGYSKIVLFSDDTYCLFFIITLISV